MPHPSAPTDLTASGSQAARLARVVGPVAGVGVRALVVLGLTKIVALSPEGAGGVALWSHALNLMALLTVLPVDGLSRAIKLSYGWAVSPRMDKDTQPPALTDKDVVSLGQLWLLGSALMLTVLGAALPWIAPVLFGGRRPMAEAVALGTAAGTGAGLIVIGQGALALAQAQGQIARVVFLQAVPALVGGGLFLLFFGLGQTQADAIRTAHLSEGLMWGGLVGWVGYTVGQGLGGLAGTANLLKGLGQALAEGVTNLRSEAGRRFAGVVLRYTGLAGAVAVSGRLGDFLVRGWVLRQLPLEEVGYWQGAVRLGEAALLPVQTLMATYFLVAASRLASDRLGLEGYQGRIAGQILLWGALVTGALWLWAGPILEIVYAPAFREGGVGVYRWQLPGDWLRAASLVPSMAMLAAGQVARSFWTQAASLAIYLLLLIPLTTEAALTGTGGRVLGLFSAVEWLSVAYTLRYAGFFSLCWALRPKAAGATT